MGCYDNRSPFSFNSLTLNGLVVDPMDFDTIKHLMCKDAEQKPQLIIRDLYIQDEDTHSIVLDRFNWFPRRLIGSISLHGPESIKSDMMNTLENFLKNYQKQKNIALEYRFEEIDNLHMKYIEYYIKKYQAFQSLQLTGDNHVFRYSRDSGKILNYTLPEEEIDLGTPNMQIPYDEYGKFESEEIESADEDLSFFLGEVNQRDFDGEDDDENDNDLLNTEGESEDEN